MSHPNQSLLDEIATQNRKRRSWLNRIRVALTLPSAEYFDYRLARPNWHGIPVAGLTWDEVSKLTMSSIEPMTFTRCPTHCPICAQLLVKYQSDYQRIEQSGQFMVWGVYCPEGHWTHLDWA